MEPIVLPPVRQRVEEAAGVIRKAWRSSGGDPDQAPDVIVTTGSGLGAIADGYSSIEFEISYGHIPHLPPSRIIGHAGRLVIGQFGGRKTLMLDGRVHGYEGHDPLTQVLPFLIANELCGKVRLAVFTNAVGAINQAFHVGQLMLIKDHINFTGQAVLTLNEDSDFGGGNLDMTYAYSAEHREILKELAYMRLKLLEGVYIGVRGAMFETPAEIEAFRRWGADAVGMSTVHEVAAANRLDIPVVGISVITNIAAGIKPKRLTHEEVLENTKGATQDLRMLILGLLEKTG